MSYKLFYWPSIPGRGEFVRLVLEDAAAEYVDVGRERGGQAVGKGLDAEQLAQAPFAPPYLRYQGITVSHVANILQFIGPQLDLVPATEADRLWCHGLQLTITDFVTEIHNVHHPLGPGLHYEEQETEARSAAERFREERLPKYLQYFEDVLYSQDPHTGWLAGSACSTADISLFQVMTGLSFAFPNAVSAMAAGIPKLCALVERVAERPHLAAYLESDRRMAFNNDGIFRHYPELDARR